MEGGRLAGDKPPHQIISITTGAFWCRGKNSPLKILLVSLSALLVFIAVMIGEGFYLATAHSAPKLNLELIKQSPDNQRGLFASETLPFIKDFSDIGLLARPDSQEFILKLPRVQGWDEKKLETELRQVLAMRHPVKKPVILPDNTQSVELMFEPNRFPVQKLPSFGINIIKTEDEVIAFIVEKNDFIISNSPKLLFSQLLK